MLVLSRKVGQRILVGEDITITVVRVTGGGVRIGIEAPEGLPVVREEVKMASERGVNSSAREREQAAAGRRKTRLH